MKNINYDLIKLLHLKMDIAWRLEKYYIEDAKKEKCHSAAALEKMLADEKKHIETLKKELEQRVKAEVFN